MNLAELNQRLRQEAAKVIVGQEEAFTQVVVAFLAGGHVLLEGVPGVAKTLIAKTLARLVGDEERERGALLPAVGHGRDVAAHVGATLAQKAYAAGVASELPKPLDLPTGLWDNHLHLA